MEARGEATSIALLISGLVLLSYPRLVFYGILGTSVCILLIRGTGLSSREPTVFSVELNTSSSFMEIPLLAWKAGDAGFSREV